MCLNSTDVRWCQRYSSCKVRTAGRAATRTSRLHLVWTPKESSESAAVNSSGTVSSTCRWYDELWTLWFATLPLCTVCRGEASGHGDCLQGHPRNSLKTDKKLFDTYPQIHSVHRLLIAVTMHQNLNLIPIPITRIPRIKPHSLAQLLGRRVQQHHWLTSFWQISRVNCVQLTTIHEIITVGHYLAYLDFQSSGLYSIHLFSAFLPTFFQSVSTLLLLIQLLAGCVL